MGRATAALGVLLLPATASAVVLSFASSDQGWVADTEWGDSANAFAWVSTGTVGGQGAWVAEGAPANRQTLTSPLFTVLADGPVSVSILHRYNFTAVDGDAIDGGHIRYRVNDGPWVELSVAEIGSYTDDGIDSLLFEEGWSSRSPGYDEPAYTTSTGTLGSFSQGDLLTLQFRAGWGANPADGRNWEIGSIEVSNLAAVPEPETWALAGCVALGAVAAVRRMRAGRGS